MKSRARPLLTLLAAILAVVGLAALPAVSHAGPAVPAEDRSEAADAAPASAEETVAAMQPGWNLGNTLDATGDDETSWGNPRVTRELLAAVKAEGFNSVRIPVTWTQYQGEAPDHTIDADHLARVREVVDMALAEDLYVLVNVHHDSWQWVMDLPTRHDEVLNRYTATWTQIAEAFADAPAEVLFESINEPFFEGSSGDAHNAELLHELNATFHEIVRSTGGRNAERVLVLPTLQTSADQARLDELNATFDALDDPNLAATVHYYGFWPFSVNVAGYTRFDEETEADLTGMFERVDQSFVSRGIPVILGEYGLLGFDRHTGTVQQGEKLKFFEAFGAEAREHGVTTMLWDNGQHLDRVGGFGWQDPALFAHISASWSGRSGTASSDQVYVERGADPGDATLTLNPNGHTLTAVTHDGQPLAEGADYTVTGDQLTLSAELLTELTAGQEHGVNATLELEYSSGVPWQVRVLVHETPTLESASGTTEGLLVPAAFLGDQLATMEAYYDDGSIAGPQDWTPFKEFGYTFDPDYEAGTVALTAEFFAEVRDGATVELTFHFWSGATVDYTLTTSGSTVTGAPA
ncbi:Aryl-phospho-beta-D-glucosidase BglC, GH1 family [Streptomyces zhaozhouensis]|uniref:Aryl-phospho-beta-D-glucosidase BglC, GH1 family n=1 Tax=Streptomyces zhaozhouensis TaxID=1300267 RepID=A0A286E0A7_9ACTN|nr:cellulase family glycosylhydrolase [Streptomyces zhaozhouensis]SOD64351.1 Aryl-phospho-beta-D-glucosidase BglC, GH1 family [Streptomyces zhaozhouensis]